MESQRSSEVIRGHQRSSEVIIVRGLVLELLHEDRDGFLGRSWTFERVLAALANASPPAKLGCVTREAYSGR